MPKPKKAAANPLESRTAIPVGEVIREKRIAKGWSIETLAAEAGVSEDLVKRAERSKPVFPTSLAKLANGLGVRGPHAFLPPLAQRYDLEVDRSVQEQKADVDFYVTLAVGDAQAFLEILRNLLQLKHDIRIVRIEPGGSVFITVEMPYELTLKLGLFEIAKVLRGHGVRYFIVYPPLSSNDPVYLYKILETPATTTTAGKRSRRVLPAFQAFPLAEQIPRWLGLMLIGDRSLRHDTEATDAARRSKDVRFVYRYVPALDNARGEEETAIWRYKKSLKTSRRELWPRNVALRSVLESAPGVVADRNAIPVIRRYLALAGYDVLEKLEPLLSQLERYRNSTPQPT